MSDEKKVVLITGGAMGQGRAHAVKYAENGFNVVLADMLDPEDERLNLSLVEPPGRTSGNLCSRILG
mgnify:CR=1 FL=1